MSTATWFFFYHSFEALKNFQGKNVDIPTLKAATVNTDGQISIFFKPCSQKALKSVTDVNKNT